MLKLHSREHSYSSHIRINTSIKLQIQSSGTDGCYESPRTDGTNHHCGKNFSSNTVGVVGVVSFQERNHNGLQQSQRSGVLSAYILNSSYNRLCDGVVRLSTEWALSDVDLSTAPSFEYAMTEQQRRMVDLDESSWRKC